MTQNATRPRYAGSESSPIDVSPALLPHRVPRRCFDVGHDVGNALEKEGFCFQKSRSLRRFLMMEVINCKSPPKKATASERNGFQVNL